MEIRDAVERLQKRKPKVHCLTNPVTMQDVANILLAAGGSAIMAQDAEEAAEITAFCQATYLNTGVPDAGKFKSCILAGKRANELEHPVVLDPVGVRASAFRKAGLKALLSEVHPSVIRCNQEEALTLIQIQMCGAGNGVPEEQGCGTGNGAPEEQERGAGNGVPEEQECGTGNGMPEEQEHGAGNGVPEEQERETGNGVPSGGQKTGEPSAYLPGGVESSVSLGTAELRKLAGALARLYRCTVLISGKKDVVSDGAQCAVLSGGDDRIRRITGSGCMLSALCALFCGTGLPAYDAVCAAGQIWKESSYEAGIRTDNSGGGIGSFHVHLFDALDEKCHGI